METTAAARTAKRAERTKADGPLEERPLLLWERGHQDKKKPYRLLTQRGQLNVDLDRHCGEERTEGK